MKKQIIILSLILLFISIFIACESPAGHRGVSFNIKESKKRNVFIKEYSVYQNPYKINDSLKITVNEAWLENQWAYSEKEEETILYNNNSYQLCINSNENDLKGCAIYWTVGIDYDKNLRISSNNSLMGDLKSIPGDTIEFKVQKGDNFNDSIGKIILGKFVLIKK